MEATKSIEGRFKYRHYEVTWIHEDPAPEISLDTVTRTFGHGVDYAEHLTFEDPKDAEQKFLNWVMMLACLSDEQALTLFTSLKKKLELEEAAKWNNVVMAAQVAQSASRTYLEAKHDLGRSPSETSADHQAYVEAKRQLLAALAELNFGEVP